MMTPERISVDAQVCAKAMVEKARPDQLKRLIEDVLRRPSDGGAHGA